METRKHSWSYDNIGGSTRVKITTGADIAHLADLDPKKWTVLSCPTTGLDIDDKSLKYIDSDNDGRIRISDIVSTAQWLTAVVKNADMLVKGDNHIDIEQFNQEDKDGRILYNSAKQILANLGKEGTSISLADTKDPTVIFAKTRFNGDAIITAQTPDNEEEIAVISTIIKCVGSVTDRSGENGVNAELVEKFYQALAAYSAWQAAAIEAPFGTDTDKAIEAYNALDAKMKDFFVRSELASFSPESTGKLDVQASLIETISADNLAEKSADTSVSYPDSRSQSM